MRLKHEQLEMIKEKFGVKNIWSYSRVNSFLNEPFEYRMTYLEKIGRGQSVYGHLGTACHDIIQDHTDGKYPYDKMVDKFDEAILDWRMNHSELKFVSQKVEDGYIKNVRNYFETTEIIPYDITNEAAVCIHLKDEKRDKQHVFVGYMDAEYVDDEGIFNIVDYKTSSKSGFSGKKLKESSRQLLLYAIGINQFRGIPLENIRLRFDMMKYYEIRFMLKNGKMSKTVQERASWVSAITKRIQRALLDLDYDPIESDEMMEIASMNNNLDNMPKEIQDMFTLHNYYIDVDASEEDANELKELFCDTIADIEERENGVWEEEFPEPIIHNGNRFYFEQLASHLLPHMPRYQEEKKMLEAREGVQDEDLLSLFN